MTDWSDLAEWYDEKIGDEGDDWHRTLLDPALFDRIGNVIEQRVLDVPCGNGYNTRRLARLGAIVTGLDISAPLIARNRAREERQPMGVIYHAADAAHMDMFPTDAFDLVISQMGLMDMLNASAAIGEMGRVLRIGGRFLALFAHPCFDIPERSAWVSERMGGAERTIWRKVRRYTEPFTGHIHWHVNDELVQTASYHRPLSWYVRQMRSAGLVLTGLEEPEPSEEFIAHEPEGAWMAEIPLHILIEARRFDL